MWSGSAVPYNQIIIPAVRGNLGTDAWGYGLMQGNSVDVTSIVNLPMYYFFMPNVSVSVPQVIANSEWLEPDVVVPGADFCVGQFITFSLHGVLDDSVAAKKYQWCFGGVFYNQDTNPCPTCSTDPIVNPNLLTNSYTTCWFVSASDGLPDIDSASVTCTMTFHNGQPPLTVNANGLFNMWRPQVTISPATLPSPSGVAIRFTAGGYVMQYGTPSQNGITFYYTIVFPENVSGDLSWTQVISQETRELEDSASVNHVTVQNGNGPYVDVPYPYNQYDPVTHTNPVESPFLPLPLGYVWGKFEFPADMWLMFTPPDGHLAPLTKVNWSWSGTATVVGAWSADGGGQVNSIANTDVYPQWQSSITSRHWNPPDANLPP